jgi:DNA-directed RNA polymerase specialized sigma subunit
MSHNKDIGKREKRKEKKEKEKVPEEKKPPTELDKERERNSIRYQSAREKKNEEIRKVLANTNGEFTEKEKELFSIYSFEDKEPEETMRILKVTPDEFWKLVRAANEKMRVHIRNFSF